MQGHKDHKGGTMAGHVWIGEKPDGYEGKLGLWNYTVTRSGELRFTNMTKLD